MGLPMAKNLLKAGYPLKAYNRTQAKAEKLKKYNAEIVKTIKEAVNGSDVIITMLTDDHAVDCGCAVCLIVVSCVVCGAAVVRCCCCC